MTDSALFAHHYDRIYAHKDYSGEVDTVLAMYERWHGGKPRSVLDVGCGTGNHAVEFARRRIYAVGVDTDPDMIAVAQSKADGCVPDFHCAKVGDIAACGFDLAVALFNVVNYVLGLDDLLALFRDVADRLNDGGLFVVDAWNGVSAVLDPPTGGAVTDRMGGAAIMHKCYEMDGARHRHSYAHKLWPPWVLTEAARLAGLAECAVTPQMQPEYIATEKTWKLTLVFQKATPCQEGNGGSTD